MGILTFSRKRRLSCVRWQQQHRRKPVFKLDSQVDGLSHCSINGPEQRRRQRRRRRRSCPERGSFKREEEENVFSDDAAEGTTHSCIFLSLRCLTAARRKCKKGEGVTKSAATICLPLLLSSHADMLSFSHGPGRGRGVQIG